MVGKQPKGIIFMNLKSEIKKFTRYTSLPESLDSLKSLMTGLGRITGQMEYSDMMSGLLGTGHAYHDENSILSSLLTSNKAHTANLFYLGETDENSPLYMEFLRDGDTFELNIRKTNSNGAYNPHLDKYHIYEKVSRQSFDLEIDDIPVATLRASIQDQTMRVAEVSVADGPDEVLYRKALLRGIEDLASYINLEQLTMKDSVAGNMPITHTTKKAKSIITGIKEKLHLSKPVLTDEELLMTALGYDKVITDNAGISTAEFTKTPTFTHFLQPHTAQTMMDRLEFYDDRGHRDAYWQFAYRILNARTGEDLTSSHSKEQ